MNYYQCMLLESGDDLGYNPSLSYGCWYMSVGVAMLQEIVHDWLLFFSECSIDRRNDSSGWYLLAMVWILRIECSNRLWNVSPYHTGSLLPCRFCICRWQIYRIIQWYLLWYEAYGSTRFESGSICWILTPEFIEDSLVVGVHMLIENEIVRSSHIGTCIGCFIIRGRCNLIRHIFIRSDKVYILCKHSEC